MAEKNIHEKHRERMRAKLLSSEGDILEEHEALEMLLYACQKQKNKIRLHRICSSGSDRFPASLRQIIMH